jgi:hypothetical protein
MQFLSYGGFVGDKFVVTAVELRENLKTSSAV